MGSLRLWHPTVYTKLLQQSRRFLLQASKLEGAAHVKWLFTMKSVLALLGPKDLDGWACLNELPRKWKHFSCACGRVFSLPSLTCFTRVDCLRQVSSRVSFCKLTPHLCCQRGLQTCSSFSRLVLWWECETNYTQEENSLVESFFEACLLRSFHSLVDNFFFRFVTSTALDQVFLWLICLSQI